MIDIESDLSKYDNYDEEMKMSVCKAAFELNPNYSPVKIYFKLAREVGYKIPKKWEKLFD